MRLTYEKSKEIYEDARTAAQFQIDNRHVTGPTGWVPVPMIDPDLGSQIVTRIRAWRDENDWHGYGSKLNEDFIKEHLDTDEGEGWFARFLFRESNDPETKLYLKMKWGF